MTVNAILGAVCTTDTLVRTGVTLLHNVILSSGASAGTRQLNDSTDDSGTDLLGRIEPPATASHVLGPFDPPMRFGLGLYIDIPGAETSVMVNVLYSEG